jgi:hypothetical protein
MKNLKGILFLELDLILVNSVLKSTFYYLKIDGNFILNNIQISFLKE